MEISDYKATIELSFPIKDVDEEIALQHARSVAIQMVRDSANDQFDLEDVRVEKENEGAKEENDGKWSGN
jgi:hypothetical protein